MINEKTENLWRGIKHDKLEKIIAGPCAVESYSQLERVAKNLKKNNIGILRAGAYKPRTSPNTFQGLGKEGIRIIQDVCKEYNLFSITEIMDIRDLDYIVDCIDIIQVGSRNMFNFSLLKELGNINKPIFLKRGLMATIGEFIYAAEYVWKGGNNKIIMCERGIRTFEVETRNTLDLSCVALLKQQTDFPVAVDLSHSLGRKDIMNIMAKASIASGADMLMLEVHPSPKEALSDANQQLNFKEFEELLLHVK